MAPLLRKMPQQERLLEPLLTVASRYVHFPPREGVNPRVIHAGGKGSRRGGKILHLFYPQTMALEEESELHHVIKGTPRMP